MTERLRKCLDFLQSQDRLGSFYGIYSDQNWIGDPTETIYNADGIIVDACYSWGYIEVFGLDWEEFDELWYCL